MSYYKWYVMKELLCIMQSTFSRMRQHFRANDPATEKLLSELDQQMSNLESNLNWQLQTAEDQPRASKTPTKR